MRRSAAGHPRGLQLAHELAADALDDQGHAGDDDDQPDDADQPPAAGVMHDRGGRILLLGGLVAVHARDHLERQVGQGGVDQPAAQRLQPGAGAVPLPGDAEGRFAEPPQRVGGEADAEQPQRDQAVRLAREQLESALLVGFARSCGRPRRGSRPSR